jgi:hypothetical protein
MLWMLVIIFAKNKHKLVKIYGLIAFTVAIKSNSNYKFEKEVWCCFSCGCIRFGTATMYG